MKFEECIKTIIGNKMENNDENENFENSKES